MALLLPQCGPPDSLHQLASIRQRLHSSVHQHRSRKPARGTRGTTESSTKASASSSSSSDHFRVPSTEPCCNLISPLVLAPRKPVRRSSRLRVRKGRDDFKTTDTPSDLDAAEWINRVLANNGVVEVDPVTMAEQMQYHAKRETEPANSQYHSASLSSSSEVSDYFPPRGPGFPNRFPRVPLGVVLAAGSAVVLAIFAVLIQSLNRHIDRTASTKSDSEGNNLATGFTGEPVSPSKGSPRSPQSPRDSKLPKEVMATGAGLFSKFQSERNKPVSPSLSKGEKSQQQHQQGKYSSVAPFFSSDRSPATYSRPAPSISKWQEEKYNSVTPFFASDRLTTRTETVTPFFPDERGSESNKKTENSSSSSKPVKPFFADEQQGSQTSNGPSLETVTPFFADEQQGSQRKNGSSLENVPPFFADEQQGRSSTGTPQSIKLENVPPFFPDDRVARSGSGGEQPQRDSLAETMSKLPKMVDLRGGAPVKGSKLTDQRSLGAERVFTPIPGDVLSGPLQSEGKEMLAEIAGKSQGQHKEFLEGSTEQRLTGDGFSFKGEEAPSMEVEEARLLSPEELALLEEIKAEEERRYAKMRALQSAFPALAIGAGAVGALVGVDGAFEMVGLTATASFISYELLWANKRQELLDEISRITDHHKLFRFLQKRKIVKDDC